MKTKQDQIEKIMCMFNKLKRGDYCVDNCYGCCGDEKIDITCHDVVVNFIQALMQSGYGDISEYKTEREMLGSQIKVLKQRLNDKYIEIDNLNRDYSNAFERLKSQQQEIDGLKAENTRLKTEVKEFEVELNARLTCDFVKTAQTHAVQDFAEKAKAKSEMFLVAKGDGVYGEKPYVSIEKIDELLKEYEK